MKVLILSGPSGCGKSTWAKARASRSDARIFSADDYMISDGIYRFEPALLFEAHPWCFKNFMDIGLRGSHALVIVDNTNTSAVEISPYYLAAQAYGYEAEIVRFEGEIHPNVHGTPDYKVQEQNKRFLTRDVMPWWTVTTA